MEEEEYITATQLNLAETLEQDTIIVKNYILIVGKKVTDTIRRDDYLISSITKEGISLVHQPFFAADKKPDMFVSFNELIAGFKIGRLEIEGFTETTETGKQQNITELKRAIIDVLKEIERNEIAEEKNRRLKELEELQNKQTRIELKKKTKRLAKQIRTVVETEYKKKQEEEKERQRIIKEEENKNKRIRTSKSKAKSQQQRFRLMTRKNF